MSSFKRDKKEEEEAASNPMQNLEKTAVLQETRMFNETPVNARKCTHILTKILYLINQGEVLGTREATECFFAMTKLFQSKDVVMRRMVYLGIKELSPIADDVIIVTSSLTKDMTGKEDLYRAPAIRALCSITDQTMLQAVERYMKQCIVDRNAPVSSGALVSSLHLASTAGDVVKRWVNEAQEAVNSDNIMVQYHGLGLLYHIRKADRLGVTKMVNKLVLKHMKSPYATCFLIRIACKLLEEDDAAAGNASPPAPSPLFTFIENCLRNKSEMVIYEAAHAIVNLKRTNTRELSTAVSILQLFCNSSKATLRFAAVRTMNRVATVHPPAITVCNLDLENLIADSNRSVATLAITTLLKTGAESSVERLMKQIATFVAEISDEFKVVVVQAIRALCTKFPRKHAVMMNFLSGMLREEGGLDYKTSIVDTIILAIEENPDAKETGLAHLCEFIEDCEHTSLAVRILHLLGKEGPFSKCPSRYIRFIYNRVILENATVRAAAVAAIAQFGASCPDLLPNVLVLLARCKMDSDDEVRDRATYYHSILNQPGASALVKGFVADRDIVSLPLLEKSLTEYLKGPLTEPFDLSIVPKSQPVEPEVTEDVMIMNKTAPKVARSTREEINTEKLFAIAGIRQFGALLKSSASVQLTESETEYTVSCIKHCFAHHLVFQFDCVNTLTDQLLENVRVDLVVPDGFVVRGVVPCNLPYGEKEANYVSVEFPHDVPSSIATFGATLRFVVKDCDPSTGQPDSDDGYDDEYMLEDIEITVADQMQKSKKQNFLAAWDSADTEEWVEAEDTFELSSVSSLPDAVNTILKFLGLAAVNMSEFVSDAASTHTLLCSGSFRGGVDVLVRAKLAVSDGVTMQLTVRTTDMDVAEMITSAIG
ncbi:coatomer subunit gamma [Anopheles cruzii]|uniref:coatomer subunit gamma n=1 Tax=Anopheles cruzii TaxID=68878 RepID=UPI0022EC19DF|nr:coatomer subunit gamma [Anopheles cruzii]